MTLRSISISEHIRDIDPDWSNQDGYSYLFSNRRTFDDYVGPGPARCTIRFAASRYAAPPDASSSSGFTADMTILDCDYEV